jgi:UDP-GlcNAc:undecaprenyl-phosphate GlcNAc-1-phosphate transferase
LSLVVMALVSAGSLGAVAASVVAGYLLFNLPLGVNSTVRAFMGDAGSTALGLIVAAFGIYLTQGPTPAVSPTIGLWFVAVPVFDLFATIVRRLLSHRSPFSPDHEHLHHVLADNGLSRRYTLVVILGLAVVFSVVGLMGDLLAIDDGVMLALWLGAGVLYYQMLRFPKRVVAAASWLRRYPTELEAEERSTSQT